MKKLLLSLAVLASAVSFAEVVEIWTPEDFAAQIPANPAGEFKLTANIDLSGVAYERPACFSGSLDGQGHTVSGLATQFCLTNAGTIASVTFDGSTDSGNRAFSGTDVGAVSCFAKDASYTDVIVKGYSLSTGRGRAGFFAASAEGEMRFTRCATDASCIMQKGTNNNNNNGGFIGMLTGLTTVDAVFECCTNNAVMYKIGDANSGQCTAGFVASVKGGNVTAAGYPALRLTKCVNRGPITANGGTGNMSGFIGITALTTATSNTGTLRIVLTDCVNEGDVNAGDYGVDTVVGFIAQMGGGVTFALTNCVNRGAVGGSKSAKSSGFVGEMKQHLCTLANAKSVFVNCANYGDVSAVAAGGFFVEGGTGSGAQNANVPGFYNCANYGTITGSTVSGEFSAKKPTYFSLALDNCYSETDGYVGDSGSGKVTATAMHGPYETGYDAQAACEALAARAELYGWDKWWKVGKVSGKPELLQWSGDVIVVCKVRYLDWDGTVLKESQVEKGTADIVPEDPVREGHVFIGWDKSTDCVTEDMDVTAQYRERVAGEIGSPADFLAAMTTDPSGSYFLANDIDLTDSGYTTVAEFSGLLDGAGHVLSGLGAQQLFATVSGSIVDLILDGATLAGPTAVNGTEIGVLCNVADGAAFTNVIVRGYKLRHNQDVSQKYIGLFAAKAYGGTEFVRCETGSDASVGQPSGKRNCGQGGFVGSVVTSMESGVVAMFVDCTNRAEIVYEAGNGTDGWGSGGFVGNVSVGSDDGVSEVCFVRCVNFGKVNAQQCGGIVGYVLTASKPGKLYFNGCINYGTFGAGTKNAGGIVGKQAQSANTGIGMSFTNCVNYGVITVASENAGGIVGCLLGARNNATMGRMEIVSCANYADINVNGNVGGIVGKAKDNGTWGGSLTTIINNCVNYGALTGAVAGDLIGLLGPNASDNSSTSAVLDNCFGLTASPVGHYEEPLKEFTMTNMKSAADDGYEPTPAKKALNAVADEKDYETWVLGKIGDAIYPELAIFCANPQSPNGLMLLFR